jgi:hypothetical protein
MYDKLGGDRRFGRIFPHDSYTILSQNISWSVIKRFGYIYYIHAKSDAMVKMCIKVYGMESFQTLTNRILSRLRTFDNTEKRHFKLSVEQIDSLRMKVSEKRTISHSELSFLHKICLSTQINMKMKGYFFIASTPYNNYAVTSKCLRCF